MALRVLPDGRRDEQAIVLWTDGEDLGAQARDALDEVSRSGVREDDLRAVLRDHLGTSVLDVQFGLLLRSFESHIVQRGSDRRFDFVHVQMRSAVETRYLNEDSRCRMYHASLLRQLDTLSTSDPFRGAEQMHHLIGADDLHRTANFFSECERRNSAIATFQERLIRCFGEVAFQRP